jgi:23S rRNA (cytidine1920-2'-O)/16S rRNA (cytidine1409-2'-O)-methyltransferase
MEGLVYVNKAISDKPGTLVSEDALIEVKGNLCPFVSRGGLKLEEALDTFKIDVSGLVCLDIGASTGGFSDCLLQRGAVKVYAVDVGRGQLAYKLRIDPRVVCMEKCNFRNFAPDMLPQKIDFACSDVSFISLKLILSPAAGVLKDDANMVVLVKPQFEAGRQQVEKKGIVKDPDIHREVIEKVIGYANESGFSVLGLCASPITGTSGNIEFLLHLKYDGRSEIKDIDIKKKVGEAHAALSI